MYMVPAGHELLPIHYDGSFSSGSHHLLHRHDRMQPSSRNLLTRLDRMGSGRSSAYLNGQRVRRTTAKNNFYVRTYGFQRIIMRWYPFSIFSMGFLRTVESLIPSLHCSNPFSLLTEELPGASLCRHCKGRHVKSHWRLGLGR
jgi:hypothetical protein